SWKILSILLEWLGGSCVFFLDLQAGEIELERDDARSGLRQRIGDGGLAARRGAEEQTAAAARTAGFAAERACRHGLGEERLDLRVANRGIERLLMLPVLAQEVSELLDAAFEQDRPHA